LTHGVGSSSARLGTYATFRIFHHFRDTTQTVRREVHLPGLRADHATSGALPSTSRGWAGPSLLAMILFEKFGQHQPLNRQAERYAREGVELSLSTLADQVGACAVALAPLHALIEANVLAAERLHGDDTPVPV
jgi:hypothetical protein